MVQISLVRHVTVKRAAELTGYSEKAIRAKISKGQWPEGMVWKWAPDGVQHIDLEGYEKWASALGRESRRGKSQSASSSTGMANGNSEP